MKTFEHVCGPLTLAVATFDSLSAPVIKQLTELGEEPKDSAVYSALRLVITDWKGKDTPHFSGSVFETTWSIEEARSLLRELLAAIGIPSTPILPVMAEASKGEAAKPAGRKRLGNRLPE